MTEPALLRIRPGTAADAPELARFARRIFIDTFAHDNDPTDFQQYVDQAFQPDVQAAELTSPDIRVLLGEVEGALVAYALLRRDRSAACVNGTSLIELQRFYVDTPLHGTGIASLLMDAALRTALEEGADTLWLGVWDRNARAIAFYRRHGFVHVGEQEFMMGTDRQTDWVMARRVAPDD